MQQKMKVLVLDLISIEDSALRFS